MSTETTYQRILRKNLHKVKKDAPRQCTSSRYLKLHNDEIQFYLLAKQANTALQSNNACIQQPKSNDQGRNPSTSNQNLLQKNMDIRMGIHDKSRNLEATLSQENRGNISDKLAQESFLLSSECSFLDTSDFDTFTECEKKGTVLPEVPFSKKGINLLIDQKQKFCNNKPNLNQNSRQPSSSVNSSQNLKISLQTQNQAKKLENGPSISNQGSSLGPIKLTTQTKKDGFCSDANVKTSRDYGYTRTISPHLSMPGINPKERRIIGANTTRNSEISHIERAKIISNHNSFCEKYLPDTGSRETADSLSNRSTLRSVKRNRSITPLPTPKIMNLKISNHSNSEFSQRVIEFQKRLKAVSYFANHRPLLEIK